MKARRRLFGTNGIRGVPGEDLTLDFILRISQAVGAHLKKGPVLIGYDGRVSSPTIAKAVAAGLMSVGLDVYDAGLLPTPALQYAVRKMGYNGGVMITASHNPPKYNGIKVTRGDGVEVPREEEAKIEAIYYDGAFSMADWRSVGRSHMETKALTTYIQGILSEVDAEGIRARGFKVVVDPGNGAQAVAAPYLLEELGCKVVSINSHVDGAFPGRGAEPTPENLTALSDVVRAVGADLGVGFDGDGDRSIFTDERGVVHWGDRSGALLTDHVLSKHGGGLVVTTVSTSQLIDHVAVRRGARVLRTRVGSVDVSRAMNEHGAVFGLEENGGCCYAPHIPVRDGCMTTALMLETLAERGESLSERLKALPTFYQRKLKFECPAEKVAEVMGTLEGRVKGRVERIDGLKVWGDERTWILLRPSGTEPIIRVFAESDAQDKAEALLSEYADVVKKTLEKQS